MLRLYCSSTASAKKKAHSVKFLFQTQMQALTAADLEPALADMKRKLMERNVAEQISQNICDSIAQYVGIEV